MKKISTFIFACFTFSIAFSQVHYLKEKAKKEYERLNYSSAIIYYEKLVNDNTADLSELKNLAESYLKVNDTKDAERILKLVIQQEINEPIYVKKLAMVLTSNCKYKESLEYWEKYSTLAPADLVAKHSINALNKMSKLQHDSLYIDIYDLNINSHWTEFSPYPHKDKLVYLSNRSIGPVQHVSEWNHTPFLDIYEVDTNNIKKKKFRKPLGNEGEIDELHLSYSQKIDKLHDDHTPQTANDNNTRGYYGHHPINDSLWVKDEVYAKIVKKFNEHLHTKYHEGTVAFNSDNSKMYFTSNDKSSKKEDGIIKLIILEAELDINGKYKNAKKLPFNSIHYSVCHPFMMKDNKTLLFSSNMPGGFGGYDLYKSTFSDGKWSNPVNLGSKINTNLNEIFPSSDNLGNLFFASEGWGGFGGLDILKKVLENEDEPENLGYPINSNKDDFGLIKLNEQVGYFSSNRRHGGSDDDIFYVFDKRREKKKLFVVSKLKKLDGTIIPFDSVEITITELNTNKEIIKTNSKLGEMSEFTLPTRKKYMVNALHADVAPITAEVNFEDDLFKDDTVTLVFIQEDDKVLIHGIVKEEGSNLPLANAKVFIYNLDNHEISTYTTDEMGHYSYTVKHKSKHYVKALKEGYFADCQQLIVKKIKENANTDALILSKIQVNKTFEIKDLYYDYKKHDIRQDAALVLDKLISFLNEYPEIHVELGSHSDSRGGDQYNHDLSQKRASSAVDYVVSQGIAKERIVAKGYGETKLLNKCKNNVKCTEEEHQINRRTEVKVTEVEKDPIAVAKAQEEAEKHVFDNLVNFESCKQVTIGQ